MKNFSESEKKKRCFFYRTDQKRGAGFGEVIESVTAQDVAKYEGENEHHDLKKDAHAGRLLLCTGTPPWVRRRNLQQFHFFHAHYDRQLLDHSAQYLRLRLLPSSRLLFFFFFSRFRFTRCCVQKIGLIILLTVTFPIKKRKKS